MLHYLNTPENLNRSGSGAKMSLLERQQSRIKWQQEQLQQPPLPQLPMDYFGSDVFSPHVQVQHFQDFSDDQSIGGGLFTQAMKLDPELHTNFDSPGKNGSSYGVFGNVSGFEMNYAVSRTASCPPAIAAAMAEAAIAARKAKETVLPERLSSSAGRESFKKRKADKNQNSKVAEEESKDKKLKGCSQEDSKLQEQKSTNKNTTHDSNNKKEPSDASKDNSKVSEVPKPDYIHVRARRGQATDSHSLAERVRREKISERMKYLQDLVPGCNKITGKAGMLDEIINYVQSLQRQVEFLSMKLAAVNPRLDFNIDGLLAKENFSANASELHTIEAASDINVPANFQSDDVPLVPCCGLEMGVETPNMLLRRTLSAPVSIPEVLIDSPCFNQFELCSTWDTELHGLYAMEFQQARSSLLSQPCTGFTGGSNVKMEM